MSKASKQKKDKVPKISEAEYTAYLTALKNMSDSAEGGAATDTTSPMQGKTE